MQFDGSFGSSKMGPVKHAQGEEYPLFAPGRFYDGASDRSIVEGWKLRLEKYVWQ
jgi:hypothetical protein